MNELNNNISKTISVCSAKDLATWHVSSNYIVKNIISDQYMVIVPEKDVDIFKRYSPDKYCVVSEVDFIKPYRDTLRNKFNENNLYRLGWYLQQFIKLAVLDGAKATEIILIWDADTVPLKNLNFLDQDKVGYYTGTENHLPYFKLIQSVTGLKKIVNYSFISQCFPIKGAWFQEFKVYLELRHQSDWWKVLLDNIDFNEPSGFSEYEMLGTFLTHFYADEICINNSKWLRRGNSLIGDIKHIEGKISKLLLSPYDYVSFEGWDKPSIVSRKDTFLSFVEDFVVKKRTYI